MAATKKKPGAKKATAKKAVTPPKATKPAKPAKVVKATREKPAKAAPARGKPGKALASVVDGGLGWIDAGKGYQITLDDGKRLAARRENGKRLSSVPKEIRDGDLADQLEALRDWLGEHERECLATVERWMLRSLPIPRGVLEKVWDDVAWRAPLENAVVVAMRADGTPDHEKAGLFRGVDPKKGVGVVDLDGETAWLAAEQVGIPHPILIPELDPWRELITQLGVAQGIAQLHRETHRKTAEQASSSSVMVDDFENGKFAMLMHAVGKARQLGFKVSGGYATCKVWDAGAVDQLSAPLRDAARPAEGGTCEARYWIGADSPDSEAYTGQLSWVDGRERSIKLRDVGAVAFSEGMRMAASIYAARVVEKKEGEA